VLSALSLVLAIFLALPPGFTLLAGDILRGGSPSGQPRGSLAGNPTAAAVQAGAPNAGDTLARTTQALSAVQAMQAAARAAAKAGPNNLGADPNHPGQQLPNVPNGLAVGGLQVAPGVPVDLAHPITGENPNLWQGAKLPTQTTGGSTTNVTIVQNQQQALLNWQTFNIGKNTQLTFDQTAGGANASQWIAFNKVNDPLGVPSQILGSLSAVGQIYVINANGIIFGGSSQINLHSLVASALPINDNLIARGLLNNPDNQFLYSGLALPAGQNNGGTPSFTPPAANTPDGHYGDVVVQAGAQISSPTSADHVGGRVALIGANVENNGTITTPDGQTILAAGLQVGLAAHSSSDPSLRGLDVFVGSVGTYGGTSTNGGLIEARRADVTIAGKRSINLVSSTVPPRSH
jgi:filamentous hemagglutinin